MKKMLVLLAIVISSSGAFAFTSNTPWPYPKGDHQFSESSGMELVPPLVLKRKQPFTGNEQVQYSSPVFNFIAPVNNELMSFGLADGRVLSFPLLPNSPSAMGLGAPAWIFDAGASVYGGANVSDGTGGRLILATTKGDVYSVGAGNGEMHWRRSLHTSFFSAPTLLPTLAPDTGFLVGNDGRLRTLNLTDGSSLFNSAQDSLDTDGYVHAAPVSDEGGGLFVTGYDRYIHYFNVFSRTEIGKYLSGPTRGTPFFESGLLYVVNNQGFLQIWRASDGAIIGLYDLMAPVSAAPAFLQVQGQSNKLIVVVTETGVVHALKYSGSAPIVQIWQTTLPGNPGVVAAPSGANGNVYVAAKNGKLYILRLTDGAILQELTGSNFGGIQTQPMFAYDQVYVVTAQGEVRVFGEAMSGVYQTLTDNGNIWQATLEARGNANKKLLSYQEKVTFEILGEPLTLSSGLEAYFVNGALTISGAKPIASGSQIRYRTIDETGAIHTGIINLSPLAPPPPPTPDPSYAHYAYAVVHNRGTQALADTTVQLSDGTGFFDTLALIQAPGAPVQADLSDFKILGPGGTSVPFHAVTDPSRSISNSIIRFKVPFIAPGERKVYLVCFGKTGDTTAEAETNLNLSSVYRFGASGAQSFGQLETQQGNLTVAGNRLSMSGVFNLVFTPKLNALNGLRYEYTVDELQYTGFSSSGFQSSILDQARSFGWFAGFAESSYSWGITFPTPPGGSGSGGVFANTNPQNRMRFVLSKPDARSVNFVTLKDTATEGEEGLYVTQQQVGPESPKFTDGQLKINSPNAVTAKLRTVVGWEWAEDHPTAAILPAGFAASWWTLGSTSNLDQITRIQTPWVNPGGEVTHMVSFDGTHSEYDVQFADLIDIDAVPGGIYALRHQSPFTKIVSLDENTGAFSEVSPGGIPPGTFTNPRAYDFDETTGLHWLATSDRVVGITGTGFGGGLVHLINDIDGPISPRDVAIDPSEGRVYITDADRGMVFCVDVTGNLIWKYGKETDANGPLGRPMRLAIDRTRGFVHVTDEFQATKVVTLDRDGYPVREYPRTSQTRANLSQATDLDVDVDGRLVIADDLARSVWVNRNGDFIGSNNTYQVGLHALSANGIAWVYDRAALKFHKFTPVSLAGAGTVGTAKAGPRTSAGASKRSFLPKDKDFIFAPNPFKQSGKYGFWLDVPGEVRLVVVNLLGERVDGQEFGLLGDGEHVYEWNSKGLSSGVYFAYVLSDEGTGYKTKHSFKFAIVK